MTIGIFFLPFIFHFLTVFIDELLFVLLLYLWFLGFHNVICFNLIIICLFILLLEYFLVEKKISVLA